MAVKGIGLVTNIDQTSTSGEFTAQARYVGLNGDFANGNITIPNVPGDILSGLLESAIKQAIKTALINNFGYTFGLLDTVRVLGGSLI